MPPETTLLLIDDHIVLRDGLRLLLEDEPGLHVVGEAGSGAEGVNLAAQLRPDLVIVDLGLPDMSGIDVIRAIRTENPSTRIIVLSMYTRREFVVPAVEAGCDGYIPKSAAHTDLLEAIPVVMRGEQYLHPKAATALVRSLIGSRSPADQFAALSEREQEVLRHTALAYTGREISELLGISPKTVETYRQRAMEKLELRDRTDLIKFAVRAGLLDEYRE